MLDVASGGAAFWPAAGTINVAASGSTTAVVTYTGISGNSLTGCAYVSGSATGTVSTGGAVTLVTSTNSFGYTDLTVEILAKVGQDGVVCQNGATPYNGALRVRANFQGNSSAQTNAVLRITGQIPAGHTTGGYSAIESMRLDVQAECSDAIGTHAPYTIYFGTLSSNQLISAAPASWTSPRAAWHSRPATGRSTGATGFQFDGVIRGDFNLNNATVGL